MVSAPKGSGVTPLQPVISVSLRANERKTLSAPLQVGAPPQCLKWPCRWQVFPNVAGDKIDFSRLPAAPGKLQWDRKSVVGQSVTTNEERADLAPVGGGFGELKEAVLLTEIQSLVAQTIKSARRLVFRVVCERRARLFHA